jgi:hypothetical protein
MPGAASVIFLARFVSFPIEGAVFLPGLGKGELAPIFILGGKVDPRHLVRENFEVVRGRGGSRRRSGTRSRSRGIGNCIA